MKILIINSVCGSGSTGKIVTDVANEVNRIGDECRVAFGVGSSTNIASELCYKFNNKRGYYWHNLLAKLTGRTSFFSKRQTKHLIDYIQDYKPDVIHIHQLHGYYLNIEELFSFLAKANIPVVLTLHDCWAYTGQCVHYSYIECEKWQTSKGCYACRQLKEYPQSWLRDMSEKNFNDKKRLFTSIKKMIVTTPSVWLANEAKKSFLAKYEILTVYNGVDTNRFCIKKSSFKEKYRLHYKRIVLGVAGVWNEKKGLDDYIKLSKILPESYVIVLVGINDKQKNNLPSQIITICRTNNIESLVEIYNAADVFVNLSYEETFGMVSAEAMLCGLPVVAYNKTAVPEIVGFGNCGIIVEAGNVNAVCEAICNMKEYDRCTVRESVLNLSADRMVNEYIKIYHEMGFSNE